MQQALDERQQAVLDWVGQGCPDKVWPDSTYKVSVQALQNRGLVKITKRRGHWSTHLAAKGRQHLIERGICLADQNAEPPERTGRKPAPPRPKKVPKARTNYADQLLEELVANDGCLIKRIESGPHAVNWASRVSAARKSGEIPHTQELYGYRTHRGYEIKLVDIPAWRLAELTPLPVPARLTKPHSIVAALQKLPQPMGLTKPIQDRALSIIQALITATEAQGYKAALGTTQGAPPPHRRRKAPPHFTVTAQGESVGFLVLQEQDRSEHVPTDKELADAKKYSWKRIDRYDYTPSNRLHFMLRGGNSHRASEWADLPDRSLEDQLAEIAQEVGLRGEAAERRRRADQLPREAEQRRWEAAMQEARAAYAHSYRVKHLEEQADAWHQTKRLTEYVTAVRDHATSLPPGQEKTEIEAWLAFANARLQHLTESAAAPKVPTPTEAQRRRPQAFPQPLEPLRAPLLLSRDAVHGERHLSVKPFLTSVISASRYRP
ncbi:hypothetical protein ACFVYR_20015 [Streptomyces sp. NPDC058284]|uniref:hypothetical protein n=1 Tax=unclassified Streptomyces TaxID=2593676 RepID=UPI003662CFC0